MSRLILTRKVGEGIRVGPNVTVEVADSRRGKAKIAITAPRDVEIYRTEIDPGVKPKADQDAEPVGPWMVTPRLAIYRTTIKRHGFGELTRDVFHAFPVQEDKPRPVCTATINLAFANYVEWIETCVYWQRSGLALELVKAIVSRFGPVTMDAVTIPGYEFVDACKRGGLLK